MVVIAEACPPADTGEATEKDPHNLHVPQKMAEIQQNRICYQRSNILLFMFFRNSFCFRQIDIAILISKAPTQIIVTAVHGACTAFTGHILMSVGRFNYITTEFALNGVFDDFSHMMSLGSFDRNS